MTDRRIYRLVHAQARANAVDDVRTAQDGSIVRIGGPVRSLPQNDHFHAICTDLSKTGLTWCGKRRTRHEWKLILISGHAVATREDAEIVVGIEGEPVSLRESTAEMDRQRASSLIQYSIAFYAMNEERAMSERTPVGVD